MYLDYALRMKHTEVLVVCDPRMLPHYTEDGDAGADLRSSETLVIEPGTRRLVKTGVSIALQDGFVGLVHPRSGLATKYGITVLNAPGTIDAGYRGEIMVTLINTGSEPFPISEGDRIAQLLIQEVYRARFVSVSELPGSARGTNGFGSTGVA
jgi:dUTP pyrophosphatase